MGLIQPRTLKGFRDLMPAQALRRAELVRTVEDTFRAHGYGPIDSPIIEYAEIIKGKSGGETDKELFEFTDKGGREVALRNDLTVPLARYVAQHEGQLVLPFRRYHIGLVYRGERPQRGRAREFLQCDADLIGAEGPAADAEALVTMAAVYAALDVGTVTLRVNDRRVLNGLLEEVGARDVAVPVLRALDKREKLGEEIVRSDMRAAGLADDAIERVLAACTPRANDEETLAALEAAVGANAQARAGIEGLRAMKALCAASGCRPGALRIDPSIARGLDYYTGVVVEAQLDALPDIGSVGAGGRYDDLAGLYTKSRLPGVGFTIGITRLMDAIEALEGEASMACPSVVAITHPGDDRLEAVFAFAAALRREGVACDVFPEARKHGYQMRHADRRGVPYVFTLNDDGTFHGKRMHDGETRTCTNAGEAAAWTQSR
ncbi:MAG: histidine--tRNA ligase [Planctomycetota bacterium]|nr:histidine--tRNA ligase [Planctomycetota bacterium]